MYKITINGRKPFGIRDVYEEGEIVKVLLPFVTDSQMEICAEGIEGIKENVDGSVIYSFAMPGHDVNIEVDIISDMAKKDMDHVPPVSMMSSINPAMIGQFSSYSFCPECGAVKEKNQDYCPDCVKRKELKLKR